MTNSYQYRRRSYLERYEKGWCEEVWLELTALGPAVRQEPIYSDAMAVARETMRRIRHNLEVLVERLRTLDYRFACEYEDRPYQPFELRDPDGNNALNAAEQHYGLLPLSIRMLYAEIDSIDFRGYHPKLSQYSEAGWTTDDDAPFTDPLYLAPFDPMEDTVEGVDEEAMPHLGRFATIWVMPDTIMKANASGGPPTKIVIPNPAMDTHLISVDWGGLLLVSYLRLSFKWGGFAGFSYQPEAAKAAQAELDFLTRDLLHI
jgi:hypothetical protein